MPHRDSPDAAITMLVPAQVDVATSKQIAADLRKACAADTPRVVLDLSHVTDCEPTALRVLLDATDRAAAQGCTLVLHRPPGALQRLAQLLGLSGRLDPPPQ